MAESPPIISPENAPARPLIVRLRNWIGDVTLGLPTLQRLQAAGYDLRLVGKGWAADLLAAHGWPMQTLGKTLGGRVAQLRELRRAAQQLDPGFEGRLNAIAFPYSFSSALEMRLAGLKAIGYRHEARSLLLARSVARPAARHELAIYWHLGTALLGREAPLPSSVSLGCTPAHEQQAQALRHKHGVAPGYIVICPFAGGTFEKLDKNWPEFASFAGHDLPPLGRDIVVCPGPGEEDMAVRDFAGCIRLSGVGLGAYAALLRDAALVIANDTGPGHMAAAVGTPLVSVLGPTDPERWRAWGPSVRLVRGAPLWPDRSAVLEAARSQLRPR